MSGLALCFHRTQRSQSTETIDRMLSAMAYLGPDGRRVKTIGPTTLGHLHFRTTPEEIDEQQPVSHSCAPLTLIWDGRIDNREELYRQLPSGLPPLSELSDAQLVLNAYAEWGTDCMRRLLGPFALAIYDHKHREVILARDPMGGRNINYLLSTHTLIVASEPGGVLVHPDVAVRPDHGSMAMLFAIRPIVDDATYYEGVKALMPAQVLRVGMDRVTSESFWPFNPETRIRYRNDDDYTEHFRELLERSVKCRLRVSGTPAVSMSGGLDSAPIAAIAANELSAKGDRLIAASWVFDQFPECDEREYLNAMYEAHDLESIQTNCDNAWPLSDLDNWPIHPCLPFQDPYRRFHENLYEKLQQRGVSILLSGMMGDHLFLGTERWLGDLLRNGHIGYALKESAGYINRHGWGAYLKQGVLRGLVSDRLHRYLRPKAKPDWLTPFAHSHLNENAPWPTEATQARRPRQYQRVLELRAGMGYLERFFACRYGLELRYPFRDRRLAEFLLSVPTRQLLSQGIQRPIVRQAMRSQVPDSILDRSAKTTFQPLFAFGLSKPGSPRIQAWLKSADNIWHRYVDQDWLLQKRECEGVRGFIYWLCISLELWGRSTPAGSAFLSE